MREILFRGKRLDNGEWVYGHYVTHRDVDGNILHYISVPTEIWGTGRKYYIVDPSTIGQYTGLTDKNGKKIFEGDILSIAQNSDGMGQYYYPPIPYPAHVVVRWDLCSWMWEVIGKDKYYLSFPDAWCHYDCEVIGNIYDKPELLEDKP